MKAEAARDKANRRAEVLKDQVGALKAEAFNSKQDASAHDLVFFHALELLSVVACRLPAICSVSKR